MVCFKIFDQQRLMCDGFLDTVNCINPYLFYCDATAAKAGDILIELIQRFIERVVLLDLVASVAQQVTVKLNLQVLNLFDGR